MGVESLARIKPSALREVQSWLLGRPFSQSAALPSISLAKGPCLQQVAPECSDAFRNVVECCLIASNVEKPQYLGESRSSIALRLQKFMEQVIVNRLKDIADALQGHTWGVPISSMLLLFFHIGFSNTSRSEALYFLWCTRDFRIPEAPNASICSYLVAAVAAQLVNNPVQTFSSVA